LDRGLAAPGGDLAAQRWAEQAGFKAYDQADLETQAMLRQRLKKEIRSNTYQPQTGDLIVSPLRAEAIQAVGAHYAALFW